MQELAKARKTRKLAEAEAAEGEALANELAKARKMRMLAEAKADEAEALDKVRLEMVNFEAEK